MKSSVVAFSTIEIHSDGEGSGILVSVDSRSRLVLELLDFVTPFKTKLQKNFESSFETKRLGKSQKIL